MVTIIFPQKINISLKTLYSLKDILPSSQRKYSRHPYFKNDLFQGGDMYTREAKEEYSVMFEPGDTCHMHTLTRANLPRAHQHHPTLPVHTQLVHSYTPQMSHSATMQVNWAREFHFTEENLNVFCGWWNLIMLLLSIGCARHRPHSNSAFLWVNEIDVDWPYIANLVPSLS